MKQFDAELVRQGSKLVDLSEDILLEVLGLQLLAIDPPRRAVGITGQLSSLAAIGELTDGGEIDRTEMLLPTSLKAVANIVSENRKRAVRYLSEVGPAIRQVLCDGTDVKRAVLDRVNQGELPIKVIAEVVCSTQGIPPILGSLAITVAAWFTKRGITGICRE